MPANWQQFLLSVLIVFVGPFFAPFIGWVTQKPFGHRDWVLFCILYLFALAASTKSILLGVAAIVCAAAGICIYGALPEGGAMTDSRWLVVIVPVVGTAIGHLAERFSTHIVRKEDFW
jgi:hypothetical protein